MGLGDEAPAHEREFTFEGSLVPATLTGSALALIEDRGDRAALIAMP
jgi:hypothetical protein